MHSILKTICLNSNFLTNSWAIRNETQCDVPKKIIINSLFGYDPASPFQTLLVTFKLYLVNGLTISIPDEGYSRFNQMSTFLVPPQNAIAYFQKISLETTYIQYDITRSEQFLVCRDVNTITFNFNLTHVCHYEA